MKKESGKERLCDKLQAYVDKYDIKGRGPLSVVLIITRKIQSRKPPFSSKDFLTPKGGQVAGLSGSAVQKILNDHGISRILAEEGGRTSRGSIQRMEGYIGLLNDIADEGLLNFPSIESWWIDRVKEYFASEPFKLKLDPSKSLRRIVGELINAAFKRQEECPGTMTAGAVMQHLVGAKLEIALPSVQIEHRGSSVADAPGKRKGDFLVSDTAIHVTTAPTEALIRKCRDNLEEGLRPVIVTTESGVGGARALAKNADIEDRIDILEVEQFVATNVYEWSSFAASKRSVSVGDLVEEYNKIIDICESDPSLKIAMD
jgi:hypothetical protein